MFTINLILINSEFIYRSRHNPESLPNYFEWACNHDSKVSLRKQGVDTTFVTEILESCIEIGTPSVYCWWWGGGVSWCQLWSNLSLFNLGLHFNWIQLFYLFHIITLFMRISPYGPFKDKPKLIYLVSLYLA